MELISPEQFSEWLERWGKWCNRNPEAQAWPKSSMTGKIMENRGERVDSGPFQGVNIDRDPICERIDDLVFKMKTVYRADAKALELRYVLRMSSRKASQKLNVSRVAYSHLLSRAECWLHGALSNSPV
ncbi:antiterminator Q family protein [Magnetococcales bacterium HHB-1]